MVRPDSIFLKPLLLTLAVAGCGESGSNAPLPAIAIAKASSASGDAQNGTVGQPLANPLQVVVTENGAPASGRDVTWSTTAPGGSLIASSTTDADGVASSTWTLGTVSGFQNASAALSGAAGSPVSFIATAAPGPAVSLSSLSGDAQTGEVGTQLALPLQAKVSDQFGNGVGNVPVTWTTSGGTLSRSEVPTGGSGASAVTLILPATVGPVTITATAAGLAGSPVTFGATAGRATASASVRIGNNNFTSNNNGTVNPAVDTIPAGGTVTWNWTSNGAHSVQSLGSPSFTSSVIKSGNGQSHSFTFSTPGSYDYDCAVHAEMTGRVVVR